MGYVNIQQVRKQLRTSLNSLAPLAYANAKARFESRKIRVINEFRNHPISQEIADGQDSESKFLEVGNLFSLLGFYKNEKPIRDFSNFLRTSLVLDRTPTIIMNGNVISYSFIVSTPTKSDIEEETPLEWDSSKSWMSEVENGVTGLSFYIFHKYFESPEPSRSSTGLQSKRKIRSGSEFKHTYLSDVLESFIKNFS